MMQDLTHRDRLLAPFPGPFTRDQIQRPRACVKVLLEPKGPGYLLYGGPGSGKSRLLGYFKEIFQAKPNVVAIGPLSMKSHAQQNDPIAVLVDLAQKVLEDLRDSIEISTRREEELRRDLDDRRVGKVLDELFAEITRQRVRRAILLIDDFDHVRAEAAVQVASQLRSLFETKKQYFSFVLASTDDLEEMAVSHLHSPLSNVCKSFVVLNFDADQTRQYVHEWIGKTGVEVTAKGIDDLIAATEGYPSILKEVLQRFREGQDESPAYTLAEAEEEVLRRLAKTEPLSTAIEKIAAADPFDLEDSTPGKVLQQFVSAPSSFELHEEEKRALRPLLAMGILVWRKEGLAWNSPMIRSFWQKTAGGLALLEEWRDRASSPRRRGELSAAGLVLVNFFLDLNHFLKKEDYGEFDARRGTPGWIGQVKALPEEFLESSPFCLWEEQESLENLGHDLDLFRQRVIDQSFLPIYQASTRDVKLNLSSLLERLAHKLDEDTRHRVERTLAEEWRNWKQVQIRLTRDGAVNVTLVLDLEQPRPLLDVLHRVLGLQGDLKEMPEFSIQWELVLAAVAVFFHQVAGGQFPRIESLGLELRDSPRSPDEPLYPLRDRYVIYLLRKVCCCRSRREGCEIIDLSRLSNTALEARQDNGLDPAKAALYASEIAALIEGVLLKDVDLSTADSEVIRFPAIKSRSVQKVLGQDLASWRGELFLASLGNALLAYQTNENSTERTEAPDREYCEMCRAFTQKKISELYFAQRPVPYEKYWRCLAMGLQYIVELRWVGQWIARQTTDDLDRLAGLMAWPVKHRSKSEVDQLSHNLALDTRLLAHLRDASIPMLVAGAGYAAQKYDYLVKTSGLGETIHNAEKNIDGINSFLRHHDDQTDQLRSERTAKVIGIATAFLGILVAALLSADVRAFLAGIWPFVRSSSFRILGVISWLALFALLWLKRKGRRH